MMVGHSTRNDPPLAFFDPPTPTSSSNVGVFLCQKKDDVVSLGVLLGSTPNDTTSSFFWHGAAMRVLKSGKYQWWLIEQPEGAQSATIGNTFSLTGNVCSW